MVCTFVESEAVAQMVEHGNKVLEFSLQAN